MRARISTIPILFAVVATLALAAAPVVAQDGHWLRVDTRENMTGPKQLAPWPALKFTGKSDDSGMTYEQTRTSSVDRKTHTERGHFSWSLSGGSAQYLLPGAKLRVQGKVSNLASEGTVTASVVLAKYGFSKGGVAVPPGSGQALTGEAEVPKPIFDKNGNAFLEMTFSVSGGNETKFVERTFIYKWTPGRPPEEPPATAPGAGAPGPSGGAPGTGAGGPSGGAPRPAGDGGFPGDWLIKAIDSKLSITWNGDGYDVRFVDKGVVAGIGKGFIVGSRLVFTFYRADKTSDGGFGVYQLNAGRLEAKHYNFDLTPRWQGTYLRQ